MTTSAIIALSATGFLAFAALPAIAQQVPHAPPAMQQENAATPRLEQRKTGKERLGGKWTDEQRVNDCKVSADKRTRPRPSHCVNMPNS